MPAYTDIKLNASITTNLFFTDKTYNKTFSFKAILV